MTSRIRPNFMDSPYFIGEPGNWHIKEGAPSEVIAEFKQFKDSDPNRINFEPVIFSEEETQQIKAEIERVKDK